MNNVPLILLVEDDEPIRRFIRTSLKNSGYRVIESNSGEGALALAASHVPDLMILDLGLPDIDGVKVIEGLRDWSSMHIIIVSARGKEKSKVEALDTGADDYITKPFSMDELSARVRAGLRRMSQLGSAGGSKCKIFNVGELSFDLDRRRVLKKGAEIHLTPREYRLLILMAQNSGKVLTHRFLLREIWGPGSENETQYLRVFMANLRRKIESDPAQPMYIFTEIGVGYRFVDEL
ncbi:MAG TPA: response regulator [Sediminispirochaeta sp.]|nr:response regulator [Sediminispirochaeta sp.]